MSTLYRIYTQFFLIIAKLRKSKTCSNLLTLALIISVPYASTGCSTNYTDPANFLNLFM